MNVGQKYQIGLANEPFDAIVIGSGVGGLSTAALLSKAGYKVLVLERHYTAGGFSHTFNRHGYEWDVGLHYVGKVDDEKGALSKLFRYLTDSQLTWAKMAPVYDRIIFDDASYEFESGKERFEERLIAYFPNETKAIRTYLAMVDEVERGTKRFFSEKALPPWMGRFTYPFVARKFRKYSDRTTLDVLQGLTSNKKLIGVLTGQYGDYGLPPSQSSFAIHALVAGHYLEGGSYPVGGSGAIARTIEPVIKKSGGRILVQAEVKEIICRTGKAVGVRLTNGDELLARVVISDVGARNTFCKLLGTSPKPRSIDQGLSAVKPSISHLCLYIGLKHSAKDLGLHQTNLWIYPGYDHDKNISAYLRDPSAALPVTYISFPSAKDPAWESRFPGRATIEVIGCAAYDWFEKWEGTKWRKRGEDYEAFKAQLSNRFLEQLYRYVPQVKGKIDYHELSSPLSTVHFSNYSRGELYGLEHSPLRFMQRWLRPHTPIKNLYLTGQDIVTDGVGAAAFSGLLTASAILKRSVLKDVNRACSLG